MHGVLVIRVLADKNRIRRRHISNACLYSPYPYIRKVCLLSLSLDTRLKYPVSEFRFSETGCLSAIWVFHTKQYRRSSLSDRDRRQTSNKAPMEWTYRHPDLRRASVSVVGNGESGALGSGGRTPELNTPIVSTRGSTPRLTAGKPPQDWPMTAIWPVSILPLSGEPSRAFSASAHSTAALRSSAFTWRRSSPLHDGRG